MDDHILSAIVKAAGKNGEYSKGGFNGEKFGKLLHSLDFLVVSGIGNVQSGRRRTKDGEMEDVDER